MNEINYAPSTNGWNESYRTVYDYDGTNPKSATNYQDDELQFIYWKELADYEGDKLISVVDSKYISGELREFILRFPVL